ATGFRRDLEAKFVGGDLLRIKGRWRQRRGVTPIEAPAAEASGDRCVSKPFRREPILEPRARREIVPMMGYLSGGADESARQIAVEVLLFPSDPCARRRGKPVVEVISRLPVSGVAVRDLGDVAHEAEAAGNPDEAVWSGGHNRLEERHVLVIRGTLPEVEQSADPVDAVAKSRAIELQLLRPLTLVEVQFLLRHRVRRGQ